MELLTENQDATSAEEIQVVVFKLGQEEYAVDILSVQEINKLLRVTRVPKAPYCIEGVINLRGNVIPLINLHKRFGLGKLEKTEETRIIVFEYQDIRAGIIVDEVTEVSRLKVTDIEQASRVYGSLDADFISGVGKMDGRLIILLNLAKLLEI
ncbi:MAG TPA: chemotaxis protein CheW [Syntrophothermus lipocalidus]|nr:chemotaxis protein CheW [Syntrophothermus lipocalidus]